ncbi:hypothetical protein [Terriglobus aquaticus]|uniref:Response regulatory domain-containing protein n=1 Tax=Terriglobus aquaticus TaxID=940139 RepID=A0ABW9KFB5_9BACT|nr:hypothetical protein [Terriglobus aquaticus]
MNEQAHILITGRDPDLLETRSLVLQTAGHRVSTTLEPIATFAPLESVQLLIVCHTLEASERQSDLEALGIASPNARALCVAPYSGDMGDIATFNSYEGPREMMRVVNRLLCAGAN